MNARVMMAMATVVLAGNMSVIEAQAPAQKPAAQPPPAQAVKPPAPPQPQPPPVQVVKPQAPAPSRPAAPPVAARAAITLVVTDMVGKTLPGVRVELNGPVTREATTSRDGALTFEGLRAGTYRLRFETAEFITLERDVTVRTGPPTEVDAALDRAAAKTAEPASPPPPAPDCRSSVPPDPNASVAFMALPDWIERNLIGRNDPQKETGVGRTPAMTASVVQVRDPTKERGRADTDEMLYVIAGEGTLRAKGRDQALEAGSLVVIPRGVTYTLERRGRNPLIALSIVSK
jgi:mannose-6-phosphate isomerase-like protein (cupin superfamily)